MSLVERTINAFPRGRTTEELFALLDVDFDPNFRSSLLAELSALQRAGRLKKGRDGRWRPLPLPANATKLPTEVSDTAIDADILTAVHALSVRRQGQTTIQSDEVGEVRDTQALLRYYRSALRSDPRGSIKQNIDRHGLSWQLLSGFELRPPGENERVTIRIELEKLPGELRQALEKRDANENTLALGWPIAVVRHVGVPTVLPIGLIAADWTRENDELMLTISADDVLVNPEWLKLSSRALNWPEADLRQLLEGSNGDGLPIEDFVGRLREAAASAIRSSSLFRPEAQLDTRAIGIHACLALFLPTDATFTAGAVSDLDKIAAWPAHVRQETALGALFEGVETSTNVPAVNVAPLNAEQIQAVRYACTRPLTVVTGPPGTGKSQAIAAMVASILANDGSVLVASKNHQALDAVEDRLGSLAPNVPFAIRTLDPFKDVNQSFQTALSAIVQETQARLPNDLHEEIAALSSLVSQRDNALDARAEHDMLRCDLADIIERLALRAARPSSQTDSLPAPRQSLLLRLLIWLRLVSPRSSAVEINAQGYGQTLEALEKRKINLKAQVNDIDLTDDPIGLTDGVASHAKTLLPKILSARCTPDREMREALISEHADAMLAGNSREMARSLAQRVVQLRPLWLASVLGTPKRIPLEPGMFDLVIFDEASQCDIASALPLLARARRAVVVGDSRQLSGIAKLGIAQDRNLMAAQDLGIEGMGRLAQSRQSLFDLANSTQGAARVLLKDQYRSAPDIVDYISDSFYGGALRPAGGPNRFKIPKNMKPGITWTDVPAPRLPQIANINPQEVSAITAHLEGLLNGEGYRGSIGVISPFRPQVSALEKEIRQRIRHDVLESVDFKAGTVDGFQGQERDLILFSPCVGPAAAPSAVQFIQREWRRLNVAISRAKAVAHIMGDLSFARSGKITSLQRLAARATEPRKRQQDGTFDSEWERRVFYALKDRGLEPIPQYEIAGRRLDFALFGANDIKLDLEVDGRQWHMDIDGQRKQSDLDRDAMLRSIGWRVRRFWVDELSDNMEACLDLVEQDLT